MPWSTIGHICTFLQTLCPLLMVWLSSLANSTNKNSLIKVVSYRIKNSGNIVNKFPKMYIKVTYILKPYYKSSSGQALSPLEFQLSLTVNKAFILLLKIYTMDS